MKSLTPRQMRALTVAGHATVPITLSHFPSTLGVGTIASLIDRGFLQAQISITPRGRETLQKLRSAEAIRIRREQLKSQLRPATLPELMGAR